MADHAESTRESASLPRVQDDEASRDRAAAARGDELAGLSRSSTHADLLNGRAAVQRVAEHERLMNARLDATSPTIRLTSTVVQRVRGGKESTNEKAKGEDYANNVRKLMQDIGAIFASAGVKGFIDDGMEATLGEIDAHRPNCTVSSSSVQGEDVNNANYGALCQEMLAGLGGLAALGGETDLKYAREEIGRMWSAISGPISRLAATAVDVRVANVIEGLGGQEGNTRRQAMNSLNNLLAALQRAVRARIQALMTQIAGDVKARSRRPEDRDPPPGGGAQEIAV